jgi:hypothetical protein
MHKSAMIKRFYQHPVSFLSIMLILLIGLHLTVIHVRLSSRNLNLDSFTKRDDLFFQVDNAEVTQEKIEILGYAYNPIELTEFTNYISGQGQAYTLDYQIFITQGTSTKLIYTVPLDRSGLRDEQGKDISYTGFYAKVLDHGFDLSKPFSVGVIFRQSATYTLRSYE